jgi:hypothetical protein
MWSWTTDEAGWPTSPILPALRASFLSRRAINFCRAIGYRREIDLIGTFSTSFRSLCDRSPAGSALDIDRLANFAAIRSDWPLAGNQGPLGTAEFAT